MFSMLNGKKNKSRGPAVATAACAALVLAAGVSACTSGSSTPGSTAAGTSETSGAAAASASSQSSGSLLSTANAQLRAYSAIPKFTAPGPPLDAAKLQGKRVLEVDNDQVAQELVTIHEGIAAAAQAAGLQLSTFNAQDTVSAVEQGIQQGINQKVAAIILNGVNPSLVPSSVAAAKAAGIPVVADSLGLNVKNPNVFGLSSPDYVLVGKIMAYSAISGTGGGSITADVVEFTNPSVPDALSGIQSVFSQCSSCQLSKTITVEPQDWATQVAPSVVSLVKANPNVNLVFGVVDDTLGSFITTGVKESGATNVKVVAAQGSGAAPLDVVKEGGPYIADPGVPALWTGWGAVDQAMRAMLGMTPGHDVTPIRYLDQQMLAKVNVSDSTALYGDAYVAGFKALWGVTG